MKGLLILMLMIVALQAMTLGDLLGFAPDQFNVIDPDDVGAISFPADRIRLYLGGTNAETAIDTLHVLCGWWDRPDSNKQKAHRFYGTCDYMRANYADERNLTCYASEPRLIIQATRVVCALNESAPAAFGPAMIVQNSCTLTMYGELEGEDGSARWNPRHKETWYNFARNKRNSQYQSAADHFKHNLHDQIAVTHRSRGVRAMDCRFNRTAARIAVAAAVRNATERVMQLPANVQITFGSWLALHRRWVSTLAETWTALWVPVPEESALQCGMALNIMLCIAGALVYVLLAAALCLMPQCVRSLCRGTRGAIVWMATCRHKDFFGNALCVSVGTAAVILFLCALELLTVYTDLPPQN